MVAATMKGGHDSTPLLKSARVAGVLLCYGAALDGDPREDRWSTRADLGERGVAHDLTGIHPDDCDDYLSCLRSVMMLRDR